MKGYKNGSRLYFERGERRIYFDLKDYTFYRTLKSGATKEVPESSVKGFFRGYSVDNVIQSFEDEPYANLMRVVVQNSEYRKQGWRCKIDGRVTNFATLFKQAEAHRHCESYLLLGIDFEDDAFTEPVSQFPKKVIQFMRESQVKFCSNWQDAWNKFPKALTDLCTYVVQNYHNDLEVYRMARDIANGYQLFDIYVALITPTTETIRDRYNQDSLGYGCEYKALFDYIVKIHRTEAQNVDSIITEYRDYLKMMREIAQLRAYAAVAENNPDARMEDFRHVGYGRIDKYPAFLRVRHAIVTKNYQAYKQPYDDAIFKTCVDNNYAYKRGNYLIRVPEVSQEVKDEGTMLHHCVASYISRILDKTTQIVFMRECRAEDEPYVTVEIRDGGIIQARGDNNRDITQDEREWLERYAQEKNLNYGRVRRDKSRPSPTPNVETAAA